MRWKIYITYALSGKFKYYFIGDKKSLMTLIGCIVSTSDEQCRIDYIQVNDVDESLSVLKYIIKDNGNIIVKYI